MDLIYTDGNRNDQGVLSDYDLDLAFGLDENDFQCTIVKENHCCEAGSLLYIEGTEYGGIVDAIESDSSKGEVVYTGRTFHGMIDSKILEPDPGEDHLVITDEANTMIRKLITRMGLTDLFQGSTEDSGIQIKYSMPRYISGYEGIMKALNTENAKLKMYYKNGKVHLQALPLVDYSETEEFDVSHVPIKSQKIYNTVNHLICLGSGELAERLVIHLYADQNGRISQVQTFTGIDEYSQTYEMSQEADPGVLIQKGIEYFRDLLSTGDIEIDLNADEDQYDVNDIFGSYDDITGISVKEKITKKIIKISNGIMSVDYGTKKTTVSSSEKGGSGGGSGGGAVESVNGKTGEVVLEAADLNAVPDSRTINGKALSEDLSLTASDVNALPDSTVLGGLSFTSLVYGVHYFNADDVLPDPEPGKLIFVKGK